MRKFNGKRISAFLIVILTLAILDASITSYLVRNFPDGEELNPFVDTSSALTLIFSPSHIIVMGLTFGCLIYAEKYSSKLQDYIRDQSLLIMPFIFPTYFSLSRFFSVINNLFPLFDITTPISWIRIPFTILTENAFMQTVYAEVLFLIITSPLLLYIAKRIYPAEPTPVVSQEST